MVTVLRRLSRFDSFIFRIRTTALFLRRPILYLRRPGTVCVVSLKGTSAKRVGTMKEAKNNDASSNDANGGDNKTEFEESALDPGDHDGATKKSSAMGASAGGEWKKTTWMSKTDLDVINDFKSTSESYNDSDSEEGDNSSQAKDDPVGLEEDPSASAGVRTSRRRSAIRLMHDTLYANKIRLETEMDIVRDKLNGTYQREGDAVLMHGYLHIQIIRAVNLRNANCFRRLCSKVVTDPYVTVHAGAHRLLKTTHVANDPNPEWRQDFFVPVCHVIEKIEFRVKNRDGMTSEYLGKTSLSVHELIRFAKDNVDDYEHKSDDDASLMSDSFEMSMSSKLNTSSNLSLFSKLNMSNLSAGSIQGRDVKPQANRNKKYTEPNRELLRTGVHKKVHLNNKAQHGTLEYFIEYIPKDLMHKPPKNRGLLTRKSPVSMVVPGVYFPHHQNNRIRLYLNADDKGSAPPVYYGTDNQTTWRPRRYFRDVYDSICRAQHLVYIVGWSVDYTQSLLRGEEQTEALHTTKDGTTKYSPYVGELLNQKANEGVAVNMLVWDDQTSNSIKRVGVVGTMDEQLRAYFRGSKVNLRLVPMAAGNTNMMKKFRNAVYYSHHQKFIICDTPRKQLVAYVGANPFYDSSFSQLSLSHTSSVSIRWH
jgi:C2 domain